MKSKKQILLKAKNKVDFKGEAVDFIDLTKQVLNCPPKEEHKTRFVIYYCNAKAQGYIIYTKNFYKAIKKLHFKENNGEYQRTQFYGIDYLEVVKWTN